MPTLLSMGFLSRLTESATTSSPNNSATTARPPAPAPAANVPKKRAYTQEKENKSSKRPRLAAGAAQILSSRPKLFARNGLLSLTTTTTTASSSASSSSTSLLPPATSFSSSSSAAAAAAAAPTDPRGDPGTGTVPTNSTHAHAHTQNILNDHHAVAANSTTASINPFDRRNGRHARSSSISASTGANTGTGTDTGRSTPVEALRRGWNVVRATPDTAGTRAALESSTADDKRSLRSHDGGSRSRSELAQYFPNWEEIVSNEPQAEEPLTAKTRLHITEEPPKIPSTPSKARKIILPPTSPTQQTPSKLGTGEARVLSPGRSRRSELNTFTTVDFSEQLAAIPRNLTKDPLSSEHFRPAHQRGERQEKQLRNIEKEKAQHEKIQLERLYEGLLGHDWLRVMGISGITDTEKKTWEQKRDWVLREVKGLLDKFERYREEEKRLRMEKEMQMQESDESDDEEEEGDEDEDEGREVADTEDEEEIKLEEQEHRKRRRRTNTGGSRDADALAAQQLQSETISSTSTSRGGPGGGRKSRKLTGIDVTPLIPLLPPAEEKPFVSFFDKPHLRAAALGGNRRGRSRFAFGHAVPEMEEQEFKLPRDMVTDEARKASARMRRLRRRSAKE